MKKQNNAILPELILFSSETNHFYWNTIFRKRGMAAAARENEEKEEIFDNEPDG